MENLINNIDSLPVPPQTQNANINHKNMHEKKDSDNRISSFRLESEIVKQQSDLSQGISPHNHSKAFQYSNPPKDVVAELKVIEEKKELEDSMSRMID